ncbi:MAG: helix-turn-helix transcriptional regulator [Bacillota bacterium]|nr:helix-turn-helix transcriptional regulator [Bacillota bacterium]
MAIDLNILGNNIRALRNSRRASQEEVTNFIHITRSTYSSFENGQKVPDLQTLDAICALYDISFDSLVNFDITKGILKRIYFDKCNQDVADLLNKYQSLSLSSKFLVMQRVDILVEQEYALYPYKLRLCKTRRKHK